MDRVAGLDGVRVDITVLRTRAGDRDAPSNTLGLRRIAVAVEDPDAVVAGLRARGTELLGEVGRARVL